MKTIEEIKLAAPELWPDIEAILKSKDAAQSSLASQVTDLTTKIASAEAKTMEIAQLAKQAARALTEGDADKAARKLEDAAAPVKDKRRAELLAEKARIETSIAELG